jgi:hypothetical protein
MFFRQQLLRSEYVIKDGAGGNFRYAVAKKEKPDMIARVTGVTDV